MLFATNIDVLGCKYFDNNHAILPSYEKLHSRIFLLIFFVTLFSNFNHSWQYGVCFFKFLPIMALNESTEIRKCVASLCNPSTLFKLSSTIHVIAGIFSSHVRKILLAGKGPIPNTALGRSDTNKFGLDKMKW